MVVFILAASAGQFTQRADALDAGTEDRSIRGRSFGAGARPARGRKSANR